MMYMDREAIFAALFNLSQSLTWGDGQTFAFRSRRVRLWTDVPEYPALCQSEPDEQRMVVTGLPDKTTLTAVWLIYHNAGKDPDAVPATTTNQILDALDTMFPTDADDYAPQTLGGLVHRVAISGKIIKESGDIGGSGLLVVPLKILVP
jgi:hypothetical protein